MFFALVNRERAVSACAACCSVVSAGVTLWWNARLAAIINTVSAGGVPASGMIAGALLAMCAMGLAAYAKSWVSGYACERLSHEMRMGYARHYAALPVEEAERLNAGEQLSGLQNEIADVSRYLNANLFTLLDDAVRFALSLVWLAVLSPWLTMSANLPVVFLVAYTAYASRVISGATERGQREKTRMNGYAGSLLDLFPVLKLYGAARMLVLGYGQAVDAWERETVRAERVRAGLMSLSAVISAIPLAVLFYVGGGMVIRGTLSVGALYVFINLSGNVSGVMMNAPGYIAAFRQFAANMKRLSPKILLSEGRR